jgi:hypothetical protein
LSIAQLLATTADVEAAAQLVRDVVTGVMQVFHVQHLHLNKRI